MHLKFYNRFGLCIVAIAAVVAALIGGGGEQPNATALAITAGILLLVLDLGCRWWQYRPQDDKILFLFAEANGGQVALMPVWIWGAILTVATLAQIPMLIPCGLAVGLADMVYRLRQAYLSQASAWLALAPSGGTPLWIIGGLLLLLPWWHALPRLVDQVDHQSPFFVCFFLLYILMNLIRRYFSSELSGKLSGQETAAAHVQRSYESPAGLVVLRLLMLAMWVLILLYGFDQPRMMHFALAVPEALRWLGVGGAVVSLLLLVWAHRSLGKNWSRPLQVREAQTLVTHGPYQWVRHPMYAVLSGFYLCAALVAANSLIALVSAGMVIQFWARIEAEEHMMIAHFGDAYRTYMQHTGRLLPRFRG
jgi:protein-S-isoprenylcysteine O-methyltransferase Ste14